MEEDDIRVEVDKTVEGHEVAGDISTFLISAEIQHLLGVCSDVVDDDISISDGLSLVNDGRSVVARSLPEA